MLMSVLTFNFYMLYWFYQNWKRVRLREQTRIWPFARTLFSAFYCYACFKRIKSYGAALGFKSAIPIGLITVVYLASAVFGLFGEFFALLAILAVPAALLPLQALATRINTCVAPHHDPNARIRPINVVAMVIGSALLFSNLYFGRDMREAQRVMFLDLFGQREMALSKLDRLVAHNPQNVLVLQQRSMIRARMGDLEGALEDIDTALDIATTADLLATRGSHLTSMRRFDEAIEILTRALELAPGNTRYYVERGMAYDGAGDYAAAVADYEQWLSEHASDGMVLSLKRDAEHFLEKRQDEDTRGEKKT